MYKWLCLKFRAKANSFVSKIKLNNFLKHKVKNYHQHHSLVWLRSQLVLAGKSMSFAQYQVALNDAKQDNWLLQNFLTAFRAANMVKPTKIYLFFLLKCNLLHPLLNHKPSLQLHFHNNFPHLVAGAYSLLFKNSMDVFKFLSFLHHVKVNIKTSKRSFGFFSHESPCYPTCWKQLRTLGSMLLPPKAATSPSCRGIWMASCSSRPSCLWSHISVGPATSLKRSETPTRGTSPFHFHVHPLWFSNPVAQAL